MELKYVTKNARIEKETSPHARECLESKILEIFTCGVRNPRSTDKESRIQYLKSRIQGCLGFLYMDREAVTINN